MNGDDYAPDWWYISDDYGPVEDNNGECDDYAPDEDDHAETKKRGFLGDPDDDIDNDMMTNMMMISLMMTVMLTMLLMKMIIDQEEAVTGVPWWSWWWYRQ